MNTDEWHLCATEPAVYHFNCIKSAIVLAVFLGFTPAAAAQDQLHIEMDYGSGLTIDRAKAYLEKVTFWGCGGTLVVTTVNAVVDLDAGYSLNVPSTSFCQVKLTFSTDIMGEGEDSNSVSFTALSPARTFSMYIASGETIDLDLLDNKVLEGVYGGNPDLVVTRD